MFRFSNQQDCGSDAATLVFGSYSHSFRICWSVQTCKVLRKLRAAEESRVQVGGAERRVALLPIALCMNSPFVDVRSDQKWLIEQPLAEQKNACSGHQAARTPHGNGCPNVESEGEVQKDALTHVRVLICRMLAQVLIRSAARGCVCVFLGT